MRVLDIDTKQSDGEVPVMLELWGMQSTPSLPLFPLSLWPRVIAPDRVLPMGQIELNCVLLLNWIVWNRTVYMNKNEFCIDNLQWLMCHKTKPNQNRELFVLICSVRMMLFQIEFSANSSINFLSRTASFRHNMKWAWKALYVPIAELWVLKNVSIYTVCTWSSFDHNWSYKKKLAISLVKLLLSFA